MTYIDNFHFHTQYLLSVPSRSHRKLPTFWQHPLSSSSLARNLNKNINDPNHVNKFFIVLRIKYLQGSLHFRSTGLSIRQISPVAVGALLEWVPLVFQARERVQFVLVAPAAQQVYCTAAFLALQVLPGQECFDCTDCTCFEDFAGSCAVGSLGLADTPVKCKIVSVNVYFIARVFYFLRNLQSVLVVVELLLPTDAESGLVVGTAVFAANKSILVIYLHYGEHKSLVKN